MAETKVPREIGSTSLRMANNSLIDEEIIPDLRFPKSINTFQRMRGDPLISGQLFLIKQFIRKIEFDVRPKNGLAATDSAKEKAEIVKDALFIHMDRSFDQLITDIASFIEFGFSFHEPVYKLHKGNIVWKDIPSRHASSIKGFKFDKKGRITHVLQHQVNSQAGSLASGVQSFWSTGEIEIPVNRLLHFRTDSEKNNPIGRSILRNAYEAWFYKKMLQEHEAIGVEREMNGLPVIEIPIEYFSASPEEDPERYAVLQEFIRIGKNARNNEQACIILPSDVDESGNKLFKFDLIASRGTRSLDTSKIIERYDYRIAQSMLGDFLLMGSSSTGSFALSDNKVHTFTQSLEAYLEVIAEQFNRKAIPKLYELNGWDEADLCQLTHRPIGSATLSELGNFVQSCGSFITPDKSLENALRSRADLPERDEENLYISTPVGSSQAISQRIAMMSGYNSQQEALEASEGSDKIGNGVDADKIGERLAEEVSKALTADYRGEA